MSTTYGSPQPPHYFMADAEALEGRPSILGRANFYQPLYSKFLKIGYPLNNLIATGDCHGDGGKTQNRRRLRV